MARSIILSSIFVIIGAAFVAATPDFFLREADNVPVQVEVVKKAVNPAIDDPIILQINKMSLDEKIGQMLIVGFEHKNLDEHIKNMIIEYHVGGINLLGRNVKDKDQVKKLTTDLQKIADIPLFIATDQEGGKISRFQFLRGMTPQIKIKDNEYAEQVAFDRARELRDLGVNMNFSPVVDYVSNRDSYLYNRTFGATPDMTGELGGAMVRGYIKGGVIPVVKHFPGYGNIFPDPHKNQAILNITREELGLYLASFRKIIEDNSVGAIMTAHILIPEVDDKIATLSTKFLHDILREQLGFNGVIMTDELEMVSAGKLIEQSAVDTIKASADIVISTYTPQKQINIFNRLKEAVLSGEIPEKRIDESIGRILRLKSVLIAS